MWLFIIETPQKGTSLRKSASFKLSTVKIAWKDPCRRVDRKCDWHTHLHTQVNVNLYSVCMGQTTRVTASLTYWTLLRAAPTHCAVFWDSCIIIVIIVIIITSFWLLQRYFSRCFEDNYTNKPQSVERGSSSASVKAARWSGGGDRGTSAGVCNLSVERATNRNNNVNHDQFHRAWPKTRPWRPLFSDSASESSGQNPISTDYSKQWIRHCSLRVRWLIVIASVHTTGLCGCGKFFDGNQHPIDLILCRILLCYKRLTLLHIKTIQKK